MQRRIALLVLLTTIASGASAQSQDYDAADIAAQNAAVDALVWPDNPYASQQPYRSPLDLAYFRVEAAAFRRDTHSSDPVAALGSASNVVLNTRDLAYINQPGLHVLAGLRFSPNYAVETSFLGLFHWDVTKSVQNQATNAQGTSGSLLSPFTNFGNPARVGSDFNNYISEHGVTQFNSGEINLRQRLNLPYATIQTSVLYGLRYMNVSDEFQYRSRSLSPINGGTANFADVTAHNSMFGFQLGGSSEFHVARRAWFNVELKGLLLNNDASQQSQYAVGPLAGGGSVTNSDASQQRVVFGGDFQASAIWKFTQRFVGRFGYQGIFLDGLALGSENFARNAANMSAGTAQAVTTGRVVFHGPYTGLTYTW